MLAIRLSTLALSLAVSLALGPVSVSAQTPDETFYFNGRHYDPLDYYLDGPLDIEGCERQCARDFSPCDSPLMKKTDGRCNRNF